MLVIRQVRVTQAAADAATAAARVRTVVAQLLAVQDAMEGAFTCLACMQLYVAPVVLPTCGHTFCGACVRGSAGAAGCPECGAEDADASGQLRVITCLALETLSGKFVHSRQVLAQLKE